MPITRSTATGLAVLAALLMAGPAMADGLVITGEASYRERIALPENAVLDVELVALSGPGRLPVIGATTVAPAGQVPIGFALPFEGAAILEGQRYGLVAEISVDGDPWFATAEPFPVSPLDHTGRLSLLLVRASADTQGTQGEEDEDAGDALPLANTAWLLEQLDGATAAQGVQTTLVFSEDGSVGGHGGCNVYGGSAAFENEDGLSFSQIFSTMMACPEPSMNQERGFVTALEATASYRLDGDTLELLDAQGAVLATLSAQE